SFVSDTAPSKFVPGPHSQIASCKTEEGEDPDYTTPDKRERPLLFKPRRISKPKQENECKCGNNERDQNKEEEIGEHFPSAGHDRFKIPCPAEKPSASVCGVAQSPVFGKHGFPPLLRSGEDCDRNHDQDDTRRANQ